IDEIVSILCLVAIPTTLWSATAGWLRATGRAHLEFWLTTLITSALMISTATFASLGLIPVAIAYALTATLLMVCASLPALSLAFGRNFVKV
ncbi:polysaccharide biosynthesis protein, partial [Sulfitobacter sp. M22298]